MDNLIIQTPAFYQSANAEDEKIRENFLIRLEEYEIILQDILNHPMKGSVQHYLLIGRRGSGKSTLLKRLQIEISTNPALTETYVPINLAEEQANIYKLYDLLEEILEELAHQGISGAMPTWQDEQHQYTRALLDHLQELLSKSGKKVVLLLDNIDRIFENIGDDASLFREYLLNHHDVRIIGGSTRMTEHFWKYNEPFYQFFRVLELKPLTSEEVRKLLLNWSERMQLPVLKQFVETRPGQLETIRLLTDGLPRTLQFFVQILLANSQETGYDYLRSIMDTVTPLYQERLNTLPPSQRKIILQMAFIWESTGTGSLAEATKMNNSVVSAQLKQLGEKGIVEKIETGTKNHLYRLSERFFNLWLIFTQGSPREKRKAKYLTLFLENFYDREQIKQLAEEHAENLMKGCLTPNRAALLTKAYAQSKYIPSQTRDKLITLTLQLENIADEIKNQLPPTISNILDLIRPHMKMQNYGEILRLAESIEQDDGIKELIRGMMLAMQDKWGEAERQFSSSIEKGFLLAFDMMAFALERIERYNEAEQAYLISLKNADISKTRVSLGGIYLKQEKYVLAKEQFLIAIEKDKHQAYEIGKLYFQKEKYEESIYFWKTAMQSGVFGAGYQLAFICYIKNIDKPKAIELYNFDRNNVTGDHGKYDLIDIVVSVWIGNFSNLQEKVISCLKKIMTTLENWNDVAETILQTLLFHEQVNIVKQLFTTSELSSSLMEAFLPLYYTVLQIGLTDEREVLKIPPELLSTVQILRSRIDTMREYYYKVSSDDKLLL